jgi:hypothetical protein
MTETPKPQSTATQDAARHVYGPRPVGALLPAVIRPAFRNRAPATGQIIADWEAIVGPVIARVTMPRRLAAGTLSIGCNGPVALELQHLADMLVQRINTHVGQKLVQRLRFIQESLDSPPPVRLRPPPPDAALRAVDQSVATLPEGPLRDALAALGRALIE